MLNNANRGINRVKFISLATVPYILPFVKTELGNTWYKFTCWKLHICNGQRKSNVPDETHKAVDFFKLFCDGEVIEHMVTETNRYAQQVLHSGNLKQ